MYPSDIPINLKLMHLAPIKRLVSTKYTYLSQKRIRFFCTNKIQIGVSPSFITCVRFFKRLWYALFNRSANRHPSGSRLMNKQIHRPWSISGPQKNIGTLSCPKGCNKTSGSLRANHSGCMTGADQEKELPPNLI